MGVAVVWWSVKAWESTHFLSTSFSYAQPFFCVPHPPAANVRDNYFMRNPLEKL